MLTFNYDLPKCGFCIGRTEEKTVVVNFEESLNETMSKTIEILNLFDISEIVVDSGKVSYSREGDKVTVTGFGRRL